MALFPPIVASSMPAFAINNNENDSVKIYFTPSSYNSNLTDSVAEVHVSIRRQDSNVNVVNNDIEILQKTDIYQTQEDKILNRYYIIIEANDIINKENTQTETGFKKDVLYKVQLRFSSVFCDPKSLSFFTDSVEYFSEWSQVCIIKPIIAPIFYIDDFHFSSQDDYGQDENAEDTFTYNLADFIGIYKPNQSSENLKQWRLRLLTDEFEKSELINIDNYTIVDSGWNLASAYNYTLENTSLSLECFLPYDFTTYSSQSNKYKLFFEIETKNGYKDYKIYSFEFQEVTTDALQGRMFTYINNEEGYVKIVYKATNEAFGNIAIRRSDSKGNFLNWQDLTNFLYTDKVNNNNEIIYYDFLVQSGVAYKYLIQYRDPRGRRGTPIYSQIAIPEWQHAFLLEDAGNGDINKVKQLKVKYDFQISSYKTNISESKTDTIGNQYPFIRRNGNMYYKSFPISGTITTYMDNVELFTNKASLSIKDLYGLEYQYNMNKQYDYIEERNFRREVEKFLYNSKPKLYKSTQQGNIFIKIMEVSLTPKTELDRMIYSFSGTAYEIDDASLKTLSNYGFINIGTFNPEPTWSKEKLGQITSFKSEDEPIGNIFLAGKDIIGAASSDQSKNAKNSIANKHMYKKSYNGQLLDDFYLDHLKITVESEPYLIIEENGRFRVFDDIDYDGKDPIDFTNPIDYPLYQIESTYNQNNVYLGTLFEINGEQIIVSYPNNIYELKDDNLRLASSTTIVPIKDTVMTVDYKIHESHKEDLSKIPKRVVVKDKIAQISGKYGSYSKILNQIRVKHTFSYFQENNKTKEEEKVKQYIEAILAINVDTEPGAIIMVDTGQPSDQNIKPSPKRLIVNETGELRIDPEDSSYRIISFSIEGRTIDARLLRDLGSVNSLEEIQNPLHGDYCNINNNNNNNNNYYTFYKSKWYPSKKVPEDGEMSFMDVDCPVDALIFYSFKLRRDFF